ncbi:2'-5' RNA ligase family protein, partial [Zoogloea sp.]|uniref:2'-5' RNA ligase family protein n=1 Tax=Zoogloea sp. TaxID=49181 RepID=UPI0026278F44
MAGAIPDHVFEQARQQFAEAGRCIPNEQRDFTEWHLGRPCYALWAARLDHAPVKAAVLEAARHLDGLLLADYQRQPHVTLALGGFPAGQPALRDDFGRSALESQLAALVTSAPAPFQLEIGPLASFASAPFLCARDVEGGLGQLRRLLHPAGDTPDHSYTPHVTVGLYAGPWAVE